MKKLIALFLAALTLMGLAACAAEAPAKETIPDALTLLNTVWGSYKEEDKFPAAGGDFSEENMNMEGPGRYGLEDAAAIDATFGLPEANVAMVDDAASLMHMMNANTFTAAAYHVAKAEDVTKVVDAIKGNLENRQWICGFPDKMVIVTVENYVVSCFGKLETVGPFMDNLKAAYPSAVVAVEEAIQ